jgi:hypothetical protein
MNRSISLATIEPSGNRATVDAPVSRSLSRPLPEEMIEQLAELWADVLLKDIAEFPSVPRDEPHERQEGSDLRA